LAQPSYKTKRRQSLEDLIQKSGFIVSRVRNVPFKE
jgi:hypothetical protein